DRVLELPRNKRLIVYAGTLEPYQGIDILIEALPRVLDKCQDAFLIVVGGSIEQVDCYRKLATDLGLNGNTRFTGRVAQTIAKQYCAAASVLVSPRSGGTNTPLKVYEQLSSGIPLVATRVYSHTQVLNDDVAILVAPEPRSLADGIIRALEKNGYGKALAEKAHRYYDENYSRPIYEEKIRNVLKVLNSCAV
ncbi:MAG: glycosyltransferase family 4 protein, partial [Desulfobacterales bacterium]